VINTKYVDRFYDSVQGAHECLTGSLEALMGCKDLDLSPVDARDAEGLPVSMRACWLGCVAKHIELINDLVDMMEAE